MGKNAQRRKEQALIEKYGEVPVQSQPLPWAKVFIGLVALLALIWGGATLAERLTKKEENTMKATKATINTTMGSIKIELYPDDAPKTVENFAGLAKKDYYKDVIFHRVIKDFMIQTGDPTETGAGGESFFGKDFKDEINEHKVDVGAVAMANRGPNTNGSQFFIVTEKAQPHLDGRHTVFGKVTEGMDVVRKIAAVEVNEDDKPLTDVTIESVTIDEEK